MKNLTIDVALTLKVTVPSELAGKYRQLPLISGDAALAELSAECPDDDDFIQAILSLTIKDVLKRGLPARLEDGGFGVRVVPLALQRANVEDAPSTEEIIEGLAEAERG